MISYNLGHVVWNVYLLPRIKENRAQGASSFILMVPFSAMIFATVLIGEPMTASTIIGGLIGITSVYLLNQDV